MDVDRVPRSLVAIARETLGYYSVAYAVLVVVAVLGRVEWLARRLGWLGVAWGLLAAIVFLLSPPEGRARPWTPSRHVILGVLGASLLAAWILRMLPQGHTSLPLGYDYGFYRVAMEHYDQAAPHVPEPGLPTWIRSVFEPGLLLLQMTLSQVAGLDAYQHLRVLFPLLSTLLLLPLYAAARSQFGAGAGLVAAALYAASFTQYTVYEYLYEKNVLGLWLLLVLLLLLQRGRPITGGLVLGAIGTWHRPTFLLALVVVVVGAGLDIARNRPWKPWALAVGASVPVFLPLWILRADSYFGVAFRTLLQAGDNVGAAVPEGGGTFLTLAEYQNAAITYLPLALAGIVLGFRRRTGALSAIALAAAYVNVAFALVFFNRFIIMLDLVALLLVGASLLVSVPASPRWVRPVALAALVGLTAIPTIGQATHPPAPPYAWINEAQLEGIRYIRDHAPPNATVIASNLDAPYVAADGGHRTYGPGLFDDPHTAAEWRRFFVTNDTSAIRTHLAPYQGEVWIYHADGHGPGLGTSKFRSTEFTLVYDRNGSHVWVYHPAP